MKRLLFLIFAIASLSATAQQHIYDEQRNAMQQIDSAVAAAQQSQRYVLCQVGGNWCPWCLRFAQFATTDSTINAIIQQHFVYIHVNYSKGNKNPEAMQRLGNPARFGFPVFVILNEQGQPLHIQNSAYLEEGKGYSTKKVQDFLLNWTPTAVSTLK